MNAFRSGEEMLRWTIFFGRFSSVWKNPGPLSRTRAAVLSCRNCAGPSLWSRRTLQEPNWTHNTRYLCQGETHRPSVEEQQDKSLCVQPPDAASRGSRDLSDMTEVRVPFYRKLQGCLSPSDVLDLVDRTTLTHRHISNSLTRMWETTKKMSEEQRRCELRLMLEHPGFEGLCHRARIDAPRMHSDDLAYTLLAVVKLGVSQSSLVVQTLLRVIQERLNQFDDKSLSILSTCLEEMKSSKNAEALKQGLKLILEDRIPQIQNVMLLQTMMRLLGEDTSPAVKKKLEMKALSMAEEFTLPNAQYMLTTLAAMHLNSKPLLDLCSKKIAENVHSVPFTRLLGVLKSCRELRYRNYSLFSSISDYVANTFTMWSNKQLIFFLLEFEGLRFCPVALMDAFAERVIGKPDSLTLKDLLSILKSYSSLNHDLKENRQQFLDSVTRVLESYLTRMSSADLLKAISCLCVMEHFPQAPLEKLLQKDRLDELLPRGSPLYKGVELKLHTLDLCLRLDRPLLPPTVSPIPDLHHLLPPYELPVNPGLLSALKDVVGETDVRDTVVEERVYFIDCVITLSPEAKNVRRSPEEHSDTPQEPRRIAVLCAPPSSFCFGTTHPRSRLAMKMRHLRKLGYETVLVPVHEFDSLTNQERTEALKRFIFPEGESSKIEEEV
ncbi:FAST kinase domain-containing protein 2, mitochondrial [Colossoma macropomum]|uniref:FAST kinase domain-containing protein 2, mitochondrial n=1 Tax=Colossoma macropomum TaxID=42526 RepID=UPI00186565C5|nr:FAST kinase domain-containing protein 2, mitochondrial [Colossoma macropomum]